MRAFLAIDVTNPQVVKSLVEFQREILACGADVKLVEPENLHFTIKFLGEISEQQSKVVIERIFNLKFRPIRVRYEGVGAFPSLSRMNVVWVGLDRDGGDEMGRVAEAVIERIRDLSLGDARPFTPHLTVARIRSGRNKDRLLQLLHETQDKVFGEDLLSALKLKRSQLTPRGPIYSDVYTLNFVDDVNGL